MQLFKQPVSESIRHRMGGDEVATASAPIWQPGDVVAPPALATTVPNEHAIIAVCVERVDPDEGHRIGHDRKEHRLARLFDQLASAEARALHQRLANPTVTDPVAVAFNRLAIERRKRLLAYLGSPKRRASLGR